MALAKLKNALMSLPALVLLSPQFSWAAATPLSSEMQLVLKKPLAERLVALQKQGEAGSIQLEKMAFDPAESLETRWRAVTALGRTEGAKSQGFLEKALRSPEWFMRNAAVLVIQYGHREWAIQWASSLLNDSSLVVRTAAVEALRTLNAAEKSPLLWEKFYSSQNFRGGESLWIRKHILEALVQFATPGQEQKFRAAMADQDESLHSLAKAGLQKLQSSDSVSKN